MHRKKIQMLTMAVLLAAMCGLFATGQALATEKIDLNTATVEQLETLPGIGPSLAEQIVAYREKNPFRTVEQIIEVKGIGERKYEQLKPLISVE